METEKNTQVKKQMNLLWVVVIIFAAIIIIGSIVIVVKSTKSASSVDRSVFQTQSEAGDNSNNNQNVDAGQNIETTEKSNPTKYLTVDFVWRHDFWTNSTIIEGDITNSASTTTFKDISLEALYFTKTATLLHRSEFVLYEYVKPSHKVHFKQKVSYDNKLIQKLQCTVISAKID